MQDWVPQHEVRFAGAEGGLTFLLGIGPAGVLVSREARIEFGPLRGAVGAVFDFDAGGVRRALVELLATRDLSGRVRLTGAEHGEFGATVELSRGRGELTTTLASGFAMQDGRGTITWATDQSYLQDAVRALDRALALG